MPNPLVYTISTDTATGQVAPGKLRREINALVITAVLQNPGISVRISGADTMELLFDGVPSAPDEALIDAAVLAHGGVETPVVPQHSDTVDPTVDDDIDAGYDVGTTWINTAGDTSFTCADSSAGAAVWVRSSTKWAQTVTMTTSTSVYVQVTSASYAVAACSIYLGSAAVGAPTKIYALCHIGGGTSMDIRIWDETNGQVIAEKTGITDVTEAIQDLGTISNVPAGLSEFEVQMLATGSGGKARCSSVVLAF